MQTILITGISRGIGKALAKKFLAEGYLVLGTSTDGTADYTHENLKVFQLDLGNAQSIAACAKQIKDQGQSIDILINNAATLIEEDTGPEIIVEALRKTLEVNLIGQTDFTQRILPLIPSGGHIVNITSRLGSLTNATSAVDPSYRISKAGLNMLTRILAARLEGQITVSAVHPGSVQTDMGLPSAPMTPEEAAADIFRLAISRPQTGQFWYKGEKMPW